MCPLKGKLPPLSVSLGSAPGATAAIEAAIWKKASSIVRRRVSSAWIALLGAVCIRFSPSDCARRAIAVASSRREMSLLWEIRGVTPSVS